MVIKLGVMCGGEKQGKRVWSNAIQRLVSTVPKTVHYNIHDVHDAVNCENMQVYAIWLLYQYAIVLHLHQSKEKAILG